jgi:hypothetical protein
MSNTFQILNGIAMFVSGNIGSGSIDEMRDTSILGKWEIDPDDDSSIQFRIPSQSFGGNNDRIGLYFSSSGRIGMGTKDPETAFDVRDLGEDADPKDRTAKTKMLKLSKRSQIFDVPITASIVSASGEYYGSNIGPIYDNYIYLVPTDFNHQVDKVAVTVAGEIEGNGGYIADNNARAGYHAQKIIPKGYKATHVMVKGSSASDEFRVYSSSYDVNTAVTVDGGAGNINTEKSLSAHISGGSGVYCSILWSSRGNTDVYGGYIKLDKA